MEKTLKSISTQFRACYRRMACEGKRWNLHTVPGTGRFSIFREDAELNGHDLPIVIRDLQAMTESRLIERVKTLIEPSPAAPVGEREAFEREMSKPPLEFCMDRVS